MGKQFFLFASLLLLCGCGKGGRTGDKIDNSYNYFYCYQTVTITVTPEDAPAVLDDLGADTISITETSEQPVTIAIEACAEALSKPDNDIVNINDNDTVKTQTDGQVDAL